MNKKYQVKKGSGLAQVSNAYADHSQDVAEGIKQEKANFHGMITPPDSPAGTDGKGETGNCKSPPPPNSKPPAAPGKKPVVSVASLKRKRNEVDTVPSDSEDRGPKRIRTPSPPGCESSSPRALPAGKQHSQVAGEETVASIAPLKRTHADDTAPDSDGSNSQVTGKETRASTAPLKRKHADETVPDANGSNTEKDVKRQKSNPAANDHRHKRPRLAVSKVWPRHNPVAAMDSRRTLVDYNQTREFKTFTGFWTIVALYGCTLTSGTLKGFFECNYGGRDLWRCVSRTPYLLPGVDT